MSQQELGQHYLVEIVARADTVKHRCDALLSHDFISDAPRQLTQAVKRISDYLIQATEGIFSEIDWSASEDEIQQDFRLLQRTDHIVQELAQQLRYIEGAKTDRLPWSIVPSFESLVSQVLPEVQIMLRAMWHYNYTFSLRDQREFFRQVLVEHMDYLPGVDLEKDVLRDLPKPFHIISFPSLEQKHILLHSLLGHEIGHLLVARYLDTHKEATFVAAVKGEIEKLTDSQVAQIPESYGPDVRRVVRNQVLSQNTGTAVTIWRRALEEILSDLAGACLFGPAALFSTLEMAIQGGYDVLPIPPQYYPPWRMRLRHVWRMLNGEGGWFPLPKALYSDGARLERINRRIALIETLVADERDETALKQNPLASLAYREAERQIADGVTFLLSNGLGGIRPSAANLYKAVPTLIERLDYLIPPNAFEESLSDPRIATFVETINAAWLHRASVDPLANNTSPLDAALARNRLNNLTLKAIEYSELARNYGDYKAKG